MCMATSVVFIVYCDFYHVMKGGISLTQGISASCDAGTDANMQNHLLLFASVLSFIFLRMPIKLTTHLLVINEELKGHLWTFSNY